MCIILESEILSDKIIISDILEYALPHFLKIQIVAQDTIAH